MDGKIILIIFQSLFLLLLLYGIHSISGTKQPKPFHKWLIVVSFFVLLALRGKIEFILGLIGSVISALIVSKTKKKQNATN